MTDDDQIPTEGAHRGVGLHAGQSDKRLNAVRSDIDAAHSLHDIEELISFADDASRAPEARLLAKAKALAILDDATDRRAPRMRTAVFDRQRVKASAVGCNSIRWRSPTHYGAKLDPRSKPGWDRRIRREAPLK